MNDDEVVELDADQRKLTTLYTEKALEFIESSKDKPFFLFVNYMDAHWPYLPPPPFDTLFPGKDPAFTNVWTRWATMIDRSTFLSGASLLSAMRRRSICAFD